MVSVLHEIFHSYNDVIRSTKDPEVDSWLFMGSPLPIVSLLTCYLIFVLRVGPRFMENRKPYDLKNILITYNLYQVLFSIWLCTTAYRVNLSVLLTSSCRPTAEASQTYSRDLSAGAWLYFISKVVDLLDTVFFVLRKKQSQISFLHVYHHASTCIFSWGYLKYLPGEQGVIIGMLNAAVHIFMYLYYLIAAFGPRYTKYLWWKKYVTWIQLVQFGLMLTYLLLLLAFDCQFPKGLTFFFVANVSIYMFLFGKFYFNTYKKNESIVNKNN